MVVPPFIGNPYTPLLLGWWPSPTLPKTNMEPNQKWSFGNLLSFSNQVIFRFHVRFREGNTSLDSRKMGGIFHDCKNIPPESKILLPLPVPRPLWATARHHPPGQRWNGWKPPGRKGDEPNFETIISFRWTIPKQLLGGVVFNLEKLNKRHVPNKTTGMSCWYLVHGL